MPGDLETPTPECCGEDLCVTPKQAVPVRLAGADAGARATHGEVDRGPAVIAAIEEVVEPGDILERERTFGERVCGQVAEVCRRGRRFQPGEAGAEGNAGLPTVGVPREAGNAVAGAVMNSTIM